MKNSVPLVTAIFVMACVFRGICEISNLDVVTIMAFINALSLMFVIYFLVQGIDKYINDTVKSFTVEKQKKEGIIKNIKLVLNILTLLALGIFGIIYMFYHNSVSNDIISIIALGISIITVEVSRIVGDIIVQIVRKKLCK